MNPFLTDLVTRHNRADSVQTLDRELVAVLEPFGMVLVPAGFRTDLASTPKILWSIYPASGRYSYAAVVHDYLYSKDAKIIVDGLLMTTDRRTADAILRQLMRRSNCRFYTCWIFWLMVRAIGRSHWHKG